MKLYTKQGDTGQTQLLSGDRVSKDHARIAAYGDVDELNAVIGMARVVCPHADLSEYLAYVQHHLFVLGAQLADPTQRDTTPTLANEEVDQLERWIDEACADTPELRNFILPGGTELAARLHVARTICRRAERMVVALAQVDAVAPLAVPFLNRLGDLLFAWARLANHLSGAKDIIWEPNARRSSD